MFKEQTQCFGEYENAGAFTTHITLFWEMDNK
jgi:hypothetical protein